MAIRVATPTPCPRADLTSHEPESTVRNLRKVVHFQRLDTDDGTLMLDRKFRRHDDGDRSAERSANTAW